MHSIVASSMCFINKSSLPVDFQYRVRRISRFVEGTTVYQEIKVSTPRNYPNRSLHAGNTEQKLFQCIHMGAGIPQCWPAVPPHRCCLLTNISLQTLLKTTCNFYKPYATVNTFPKNTHQMNPFFFISVVSQDFQNTEVISPKSCLFPL